MAKKKSKKAASDAKSKKELSANEKTPKDTGLYFWMYVIGGILMALGVFVMYLHHTIFGLVVLCIGAVLLFYGNKYTKETPPPKQK